MYIASPSMEWPDHFGMLRVIKNQASLQRSANKYESLRLGQICAEKMQTQIHHMLEDFYRAHICSRSDTLKIQPKWSHLERLEKALCWLSIPISPLAFKRYISLGLKCTLTKEVDWRSLTEFENASTTTTEFSLSRSQVCVRINSPRKMMIQTSVINIYTLNAWYDTAVSKESYSFRFKYNYNRNEIHTWQATPALSLRAVLEGDPSHIKPCPFCKYRPFWDEHLQSTTSEPFTNLGNFLSTKKAKIYTSWRSGRSLPLQWSSHQKEVEADT